MNGLGKIASTAKRRIGWFIRDRFPFRPVEREVQGVTMVLPWSHRLPDYAIWGPEYGQNLVRLAEALAQTDPLTVLDIGANVGDSTLQILNGADGKVLCVEADKAYLEFLHRNVDADPRITVVEALLTVDEQVSATTAVRSGGTTRFADGSAADAMPTVSAAELRRSNPDFDRMRLIKSDTDGYDVTLVPAVAKVWADSRPVLFFEYDPYLTRIAGNDPEAVWEELASLGYRNVAVWDNGGSVVGRTTTAAAGRHGRILDADSNQRRRGRAYWDVAVAHEGDTVAAEAFARLVPAELPAS